MLFAFFFSADKQVYVYRSRKNCGVTLQDIFDDGHYVERDENLLATSAHHFSCFNIYGKMTMSLYYDVAHIAVRKRKRF